MHGEAGEPLVNVEVALDPLQNLPKRTRTDTEGRFGFTNLRRGTHNLAFRRIGYYPEQLSVQVPDSGVRVSIVLKQVPAPLEAFKILGVRVGVTGVVATRDSLRPVDGADVEVLHTNARTQTSDSGRFVLVDSVGAGPRVVFTRAPGFLSKMLAVTVPDRSTVNVALVLESSRAPGAKRIAMPLAELQERAHWMGRGAALVSGAELAEYRGRTVLSALRDVSSLQQRGIVFLPSCILVNGLRPTGRFADILVDDVEAVEVFQAGTDYTGTLAHRGCPASSALRAHSTTSGAFFRNAQAADLLTVVIWTKR